MSVSFGNNVSTISSNWTGFKASVQPKGASVQYDDDGVIYLVFAFDGPLAYTCTIWKGAVPDGVAQSYSQAQNDADKADFETNYKASANRPLTQQLPTVAVKSREFKKSVAANTTDWDDVVVPSGKKYRIRRCEGHANYQGNTNVAVVWDRSGTPDILCLTYGDSVIVGITDVTGDGVKKLSIRLKNTSSAAVDLHGAYEAVEVP